MWFFIRVGGLFLPCEFYDILEDLLYLCVYSYCAVHCMVLRSAGDYGRRSWAIPWFAEKNVLVRWTSSAYVRSSTRSNSFQLVLRVRQFHNVCRTAKNIIISLYVSEGVPCGAFWLCSQRIKFENLSSSSYNIVARRWRSITATKLIVIIIIIITIITIPLLIIIIQKWTRSRMINKY